MIDYEKLKGYTPGPWRTEQEIRPNTVIGENGYTICSGMIGNGRQYMIYENWEQNAQLIAAAPDLLEENKRLRGFLHYAEDIVLSLEKGLKSSFEHPDYIEASPKLRAEIYDAIKEACSLRDQIKKALLTGCDACDAGVICHHHHKQIQDQP